MSIHKLQNNDQQNKESLSAFLDAEQSDSETSHIVDALLNDPVYKEQYIRLQLMNDYLHNQVKRNVVNTELRTNISLALDDLPAHFVDDAVTLQAIKTEDVTQNNWFNQLLENRMFSGVSIAASVMFVTLFTLQTFNSDSNVTNTMADYSVADTSQINSPLNQKLLIKLPPSLIQSVTELPASYVSTGHFSSANGSSVNSSAANSSDLNKYEWIEADPELSQQVRKYVNEHETRRGVYNLQPKIRTATYQIND